MVQKLYASQSGKTTVSCPECGKARQLDVSKYVHSDKTIKFKITCSCGHVFQAVLERRRHIRNAVDLKGTLLVKDKSFPIRVTDISRRGLKMRSNGILDIQPGEKLILDFILDDAWNSRISKELIARKIDRNEIGAEFASQEHYDKLGTYILFHFS